VSGFGCKYLGKAEVEEILRTAGEADLIRPTDSLAAPGILNLFDTGAFANGSECPVYDLSSPATMSVGIAEIVFTQFYSKNRIPGSYHCPARDQVSCDAAGLCRYQPGLPPGHPVAVERRDGSISVDDPEFILERQAPITLKTAIGYSKALVDHFLSGIGGLTLRIGSNDELIVTNESRNTLVNGILQLVVDDGGGNRTVVSGFAASLSLLAPGEARTLTIGTGVLATIRSRPVMGIYRDLRDSGETEAIVASQWTIPPTCGNGILEEGENCDGTAVRGETCESLGYEGGVPQCASDCIQVLSDGCGCRPHKTGATRCVDPVTAAEISCHGTGQDGEFRYGRTSQLVDNGDGTLTDESTGLMWEKALHPAGSSTGWPIYLEPHPNDALTQLNTDRFAGYDDWRIPNAREVLSIIAINPLKPGPFSMLSKIDGRDFTNLVASGYFYPMLSSTYTGHARHSDPGYFGNATLRFEDYCMPPIPQYELWSDHGWNCWSELWAAPRPNRYQGAWRAVRTIPNWEGCALPQTGQSQCAVRLTGSNHNEYVWFTGMGQPLTESACLGSGQDASSQSGAPLQYEDRGNGTILDRVTGLTWEKLNDDHGLHGINVGYSCPAAFEKIDTLNQQRFAGFSDWRLPNLFELMSIVDYEVSGNARIPGVFGPTIGIFPECYATNGPTTELQNVGGEGSKCGTFWTSTWAGTGTNVIIMGQAYGVSFTNGWFWEVNFSEDWWHREGRRSLLSVRAVRG